MRNFLALVLALAAAVGGVAAGGIYPDGHFDVSKKLTVDNFDSTVQAAIDAGKTMFAPAWNEAVLAFIGNDDVAFGDVLLSEEQIRGNHNPGAGGWPTIRYFNAETGLEGASYVKKTDEAMCSELGNVVGDDVNYMQAYIEEQGKTSLCAVATGKGCSEKEVGYIEKMKSKPAADLNAQLERLGKMSGSSMKPELKGWLSARVKILQQLTKEGKDEL